MYKNALITIIICIILFSINACCSIDDLIRMADDISSGESPKSPDETKNSPEKIYSVGESADISGTVVTVTKSYKTYGTELIQPKTGYEFIVVFVKIQNKGTNSITYNPFDFKMQNSKGQILDCGIFTPDGFTRLDAGELLAGGEVEGTISFEEPVNDNGLILIYKPSVWTNETLKFNIK